MNDSDVAGTDRRYTYGNDLENSGIFDREGAGDVPTASRVLRSWGIENDYVTVSVSSDPEAPVFIPLPPSWNSFSIKMILTQAELDAGTVNLGVGLCQYPLDGNSFDYRTGDTARADMISSSTVISEDDVNNGSLYVNGSLQGEGPYVVFKNVTVIENVDVVDNSLLQLSAYVAPGSPKDAIILSVVLEKNS